MEGISKIWSPIVRNGAFFVMVSILLTLSCSAQESSEGFKANALVGISTSQISGDNLSGFNKLGINVGIGIRREVAPKWEACMDIMYIQKGSRKNSRPDKGDLDFYLMALDYVDVPLYMLYKQDKWQFEIGLSVGYLLSAKEEDQNGPILRVGREYNDLDVGGLLGLSYPLGDKVKLNIRASNSLLAVREHAGGSTFRLNQGQYNSVLAFGFRYYFL
jgi:hypothetical protein